MPRLLVGWAGAGPSCAQVPKPGALIPALSSAFSTFKHLWKQVAQNLDRFRTFPRLAGGKGPLPSRGHHGRGGAEGLCRRPGNPAWSPRPGRPRGCSERFRLRARISHTFLMQQGSCCLCRGAFWGGGCKGNESQGPSHHQLLFQLREASGKQLGK